MSEASHPIFDRLMALISSHLNQDRRDRPNPYGWKWDASKILPLRKRWQLLREVYFDDINWVIVGGESGPGHRPMNLDWARGILEVCRRVDIPFFFKQVGAFRPTDDMIPEDLRIREFPR